MIASERSIGISQDNQFFWISNYIIAQSCKHIPPLFKIVSLFILKVENKKTILTVASRNPTIHGNTAMNMQS